MLYILTEQGMVFDYSQYISNRPDPDLELLNPSLRETIHTSRH